MAWQGTFEDTLKPSMAKALRISASPARPLSIRPQAQATFNTPSVTVV
ncbi:Glycogen [starch] synthase [Giardia duodenalis assemblage B]|uniref:Glycogen [starch] synthase n=1 Tax=Giardia duodenalis assemblage B TaxID=1394984 RepID=A0A132NTZ1_GIAIN|nr:Glycogen [starch] synthase [Giardia intestinalis assemblage B]